MEEEKAPKILDYYVCGTDLCKGTLYGPAEYLNERQKRFRFMNAEEYIRYTKKVRESDGFDVDGCTGRLSGGIVPVSRGFWPMAELAAEFAAESQEENEGGIPIEFVRLVKANLQPVAGVLYYLTFRGIDTTQQVEKTYRAKVWVQPGGKELLRMFEEVADNDTTVTRKKFVADDRRGKEGKGKKKGRNRVKGKERKARKRFGRVTASSDGYEIDCSKPGRLGLDAWRILLNELRSENPSLTFTEAKQIASEKWRTFCHAEKLPYMKEARERYRDKMHRENRS